ncbi:MAG: zf-TFIIB domain-containing protein [Synechococcus sp. ELA057]
MNCPCCSAPLSSGGTVCAYCGSRLDLDLQGWRHLQPCGLNPLLRCPDCAIQLETLDLSGQEPLQLDRCPDCLGLFLPIGALERLVAQESGPVLGVDHRLLQALADTPRVQRGPLRYRPCPSCGDLMNRSLHGKRSGVVVDRCRDHGLWLEAGELRQLLEWARAGGALLDRERREQEQREHFRREQEEAAQLALLQRHPDPIDLLTPLIRLARQLL